MNCGCEWNRILNIEHPSRSLPFRCATPSAAIRSHNKLIYVILAPAKDVVPRAVERRRDVQQIKNPLDRRALNVRVWRWKLLRRCRIGCSCSYTSQKNNYRYELPAQYTPDPCLIYLRPTQTNPAGHQLCVDVTGGCANVVSEEEREKERGFGKKDKYCAVGSLTSQSSQGHTRAHAHCE